MNPSMSDGQKEKIMEKYVIFSHSEARLGDAGFWNNQLGWVEKAIHATLFDEPKIGLPITSGSDARCVPYRDAVTMKVRS
jgi:hypothetical protein